MANRTASPVPLEMFQHAEKAFEITVTDDDSVPVDLTSVTLRFVVQDANNPAVGQFKAEGGDISGDASGVATVTVDKDASATAADNWHWRLWDVTTENEEVVLAHGSFRIIPAVKDVA